ncbi:hypothetical protein Aperf_G00000102197 [Anoplocephala perfoliata]
MPNSSFLKLKYWFQTCIFPKIEDLYLQDVSLNSPPIDSGQQITRACEKRLERLIKSLSQNELLEENELPHFYSLCIQPWFWGPLTRLEADGLLQNAQDGSFIVRVSENDTNKYTLTFRFSNDIILNNRITQNDGGFGFIQGEAFESVQALIEFAMSQSESGAYRLSSSTFESCSTVPASQRVRLLHPYSRFSVVPPLLFLCRFVLFKLIRTGALKSSSLQTTKVSS